MCVTVNLAHKVNSRTAVNLVVVTPSLIWLIAEYKSLLRWFISYGSFCSHRDSNYLVLPYMGIVPWPRSC